MKQRRTFKELFLDFLSRLLPVVVGIAITFTVQAFMNRAHDRKAVRSAMELVRTELNSNLDDIAILDDFLRQEKISAQYLVDHRENLAKCPKDSVYFHSGFVHADVSVALSQNALELLKMSTLFPKIGDNALAMKIIRAYDTCELVVANINRHISARDRQADAALWLTNQGDPSQYTDATDIRDALAAVDAFLCKR